jgi:hypothetical protein
VSLVPCQQPLEHLLTLRLDAGPVSVEVREQLRGLLNPDVHAVLAVDEQVIALGRPGVLGSESDVHRPGTKEQPHHGDDAGEDPVFRGG